MPVLFLCGAWGLAQVFSPTLPNLYYHIRFVGSELVPFALVIVSAALVEMSRSDRLRRSVAMVAGAGAVTMMILFSGFQLIGVEGEDARFFHELDAMVSRNDVIVADEGEADNRVTVPIRYYFNKQVFVFPRTATLQEKQDVMRYLLANSGSRYGQVLVLSAGPSIAQPFEVTLKALLRMSESGISNTENLRFDPIASRSYLHLLLPSTWRTNVRTFYLYRATGLVAPQVRTGCPIDFSSRGGSPLITASGWGE